MQSDRNSFKMDNFRKLKSHEPMLIFKFTYLIPIHIGQLCLVMFYQLIKNSVVGCGNVFILNLELILLHYTVVWEVVKIIYIYFKIYFLKYKA